MDGGTVARALRRGMDSRKFLQRNDSYTFLEALGDLVVTGPTGTNVMDVRLVLVGDPIVAAENTENTKQDGERVTAGPRCYAPPRRKV